MERRNGMHELAESVNCLHEEFVKAMAEVRQDIEWREQDAKPAIKSMRRAAWFVSGVTAVIGLLAGMVVWVFLQTHAQLQATAESASMTANTTAIVVEILKRNEQLDERQDRRIERLEHR